MQRKHSKEHKLQSQFRMPPLLPHDQPDNAARKPAPVKKCPTNKTFRNSNGAKARQAKKTKYK